MSISQAIEKVEARYAHQPEFIQAVKEVAITIARYTTPTRNMILLKYLSAWLSLTVFSLFVSTGKTIKVKYR